MNRQPRSHFWRHYFHVAIASWFAFSALFSSASLADVVVGGNLTFDLDTAAFANGADVAYINSFGQLFNPAFQYNTNQTFMEFAKHDAVALPGRPAPPPTTFNDLRSTWVRPSGTGLGYAYDAAYGGQGLTFDAGNVATQGAQGAVAFLGGDSFWIGNDSLITPVVGVPASVWLQYGNLTLGFDASRIGGGNSGWFVSNNVLGPLPIFDVRNVTLSAIAAGPAAGSFDLQGALFTSAEFRDNFGILQGLDVGDLRFQGITAVPEPTSLALVSVISLSMIPFCHRRLKGLAISTQN